MQIQDSGMAMDEDNLVNEAMSWCLKNHIRVYPKITDTVYSIRGARGKARNKSNVRLVIEIDRTTHMGKEVYTQEEEMTQKINEIYIHYFNRAKK